MVPDAFREYFTATATGAGALIGLLFVSISLRPDTVFGTKAAVHGRALAGSAFTALVNAFFVSLLALMPQSNLGYSAAIMAAFSLYRTMQLHWRIGRKELHLVTLVLSIAAYGCQLVTGVLLVARPDSEFLVFTVAYLLIGSFGVALVRAWSLLQGRHLAGQQAADGQPAASGPPPA